MSLTLVPTTAATEEDTVCVLTCTSVEARWMLALYPGRKKNGLGTTVDTCARNSVKFPENCSKHVALRMRCKNPE